MKDPDAILPERALERLAALCARAGYCEDDIDRALAEIDMEEYRKELGKLLRAKVRTIKAESLQERYQKLLRYAASRGFEPEVTRDVIEADPEL